MTSALDKVYSLWSHISEDVAAGWCEMAREERDSWNKCTDLWDVIVEVEDRYDWIVAFINFGDQVNWFCGGKWKKVSPTTLVAAECAAEWGGIIRMQPKVGEIVEDLASGGDDVATMIVNRSTLHTQSVHLDDEMAGFQRQLRHSTAVLAKLSINESLRSARKKKELETKFAKEMEEEALRYYQVLQLEEKARAKEIKKIKADEAEEVEKFKAHELRRQQEHARDIQEMEDKPCRQIMTDRTSGDRFAKEPTKAVMVGLLGNAAKGKLLPKKKLKQRKLKEAFVRKNFQKFPLDKCTWEPALGKHVYQPPKYSMEFGSDVLESSLCCGCCFLKPCLMLGKKQMFVESIRSDYGDESFEIMNASIIAFNHMVKCFGINYMKRRKLYPWNTFERDIPECVINGLREVREKVQEEMERNHKKG